jgi:RTX calcium-binding nonapeptide repeat (4 copies)
MPSGWIAVVAGLAAAALVASPVRAAEVRLERLPFDCSRTRCPPDHSDRLVVRAGRGEENRLTIALGAAGEYRVTDAGAPLSAGPGCSAQAERVDCQTSSPYIAAYVLAGDRDDAVSAATAVNVDGGPGDDLLAGSSAGDALYAGEGGDALRGEGGDDALQDGRLLALAPPVWTTSDYWPYLRTLVAPVRAERDVFDGGDGTDTLGYSGRRRGLVVDLARTDPHAGSRGERDLLQGLEAVGGGNGNDRLLGHDGANSLWGGDGDDLVVGRGGDDGLYVGPGSNRARGDAGNDDIGIGGDPNRHLERQRVACGADNDGVLALFRNDYAEDDCETIYVGEFYDINELLPPANWLRPPLASYTTEVVDCEAAECRLRLDVRLARSPSRRRPQLKGLLLGRVTETVPNRTVLTLTAYLSDRGVRLLRRYRALLIRISLKKVSPDDPRVAEGPAGAYLTRLRAPAP